MADNNQNPVPVEWKQLDLNSLRGLLMVIGSPDVGKSTFARYLYCQIRSTQTVKVAFLDGDPGQSALGPPTTMTITGDLNINPEKYRGDNLKRSFVGSISPRGHMLQMVVGAARLIKHMRGLHYDVIIYDTSGLVAPHQGGTALKSAKIDLLAPDCVCAIQYEDELELLLAPYRKNARMKVIDLKPSEQIVPRGQDERRLHRSNQFRRYFHNARKIDLSWRHVAVFPIPRFSLRRLVALEDNDGFTLGLGVIVAIDRVNEKLVLFTPLHNLEDIRALRIGSIALDLHTYQDQILHPVS